MESPNKRLKSSSQANIMSAGEDFVSFGDADQAADDKFGYGNEHNLPEDTPRGPRAEQQHHPRQHRDARFDRRNAQDRPKSKHALPGHEPWILVKTKLGRRFVHNTTTKESFWHVPDNVWPAVKEFEAWEKAQKEREENARWAEEELKKMRETSKAEEVNHKANDEEGARGRNRRSESLQREDEEVLKAELAAQAEHAEEQDVKEVLEMVEPVVGEVGYDSEGSYEYVEVTDDEDEEGTKHADIDVTMADANSAEQPEDDPVEFGEDDIAFQLAAMGQDYGLDPGEYGADEGSEDWDEGAAGLPISDEDAANLFRDLLDDYHISPYTPWDKLIADESSNSILNDDRYTVLPTMKTRQDVWSQWAKDKAAQLKEERAKMEKKDPRIPYLAFLAEKATPKLYWPEFKRKYKRDAEMTDRNLADKEREKLYRDHINRLKLPESTRNADLINLLNSVPLRDLNKDTSMLALPQQLLTHLHFISLPASARDSVVRQHISTLPSAPEDGAVDGSAEDRAAEDKRRMEKRRREEALAERQRKVDEERRRSEKEERLARRDLMEEERELRQAMEVGRKGEMGQL